MIIEILFIVTLFLWLLTLLPFPPLAPYSGSSNYFAFIAALLIGLYLFVPAIRG